MSWVALLCTERSELGSRCSAATDVAPGSHDASTAAAARRSSAFSRRNTAERTSTIDKAYTMDVDSAMPGSPHTRMQSRLATTLTTNVQKLTHMTTLVPRIAVNSRTPTML